ncbi:hypothetical protein [Fictibacillus gelatini]|uniref:hypothetical protein n=1 Tax=Fictibacillus gelatini TaxID=225985 RepID=UPI000407D515|nr:hypothetical protein [Fictibacillus gelatini]
MPYDSWYLPFEPKEIGECSICGEMIYDGEECDLIQIVCKQCLEQPFYEEEFITEEDEEIEIV